jgi:hypothetical protein
MNLRTPSFSQAGLARRDFLRAGSLSLLGVNLSQYLRLRSLLASATEAKAQACILLWLEGAPSHVDTWDPKPTSSFKPISTNVPGIQVSELMPRLAKSMDKLAIIRSMRTLEVNHPEATHYAVTGHRENPAMQFPSIGSIIAKEMGTRNNFPAHVLEPQWETSRSYEDYFKASFIGAEYNPMILPDPSLENFKVPDLSLPKSVSAGRIEHRRSFLKIVDQLYRQTEGMATSTKMDAFTEQALKMILSPSVKQAFDLSQETEKTKEAYGKNGFGQSVLLARRLVEGGCRFVTAAGYKAGEWDTHKSNDKLMRDSLVPFLDQALSTLLEDLEQRGLLESTVVIAMGEFGRTPHINADKGRDHWPHCWSLALGGGGIRGGQVIGSSDERGAQIADRTVTIGDLFATVYKAFGIDWTKEYMTPIGRPIKIANSINDTTGEPIEELV